MKQANYPIKLEIYNFFLKKIRSRTCLSRCTADPNSTLTNCPRRQCSKEGNTSFGRSGRGALFPALQAMKMLDFYLLFYLSLLVIPVVVGGRGRTFKSMKKGGLSSNCMYDPNENETHSSVLKTMYGLKAHVWFESPCMVKRGGVTPHSEFIV